ncbi:MAG: permease [Psychromonas sp.]
MLLLLSILALFLGPITYRLLKRQPGWLDLLDAFIFVTISGLVFFHILPEVLHSGGPIVLVLMAIGLLAPSWIEKYFHHVAHQAHQTTLFLGVFGLVLHAVIDGSALIVEPGNHTAWLLALGVLLHRFPVGLTIWWLLRPQYGRKLPLIILASMSLATIAGALFADNGVAHLDGQLLTWFQAFVMGSIMHVVLHRPYLKSAKKSVETSKEHRYAAGIGSLMGLIVLGAVLLPHWLGYVEHNHDSEELVTQVYSTDAHKEHAHKEHGHDEDSREQSAHADHAHEEHGHDEGSHEEPAHIEHDHEAHESKTAQTLINVTKVALYSAPMLLLAYLLSALMHYFKPKFSIMPMQGSQTFFKDSLKGVVYGLPLPVCSPSASKMHQQLLGLGANQTFATAFLIATPIIGFDALLISLPLLGEQMLLLRLSLAALFSLVIAWLLGRHFKTPIPLMTEHSCEEGKPTSRFISAIKQGYQHQLDHTAPWVLLGWAIAATLSTLPAWSFFDQALWLQVLVMLIIAFPFSLCATGITPVIAILLMAGLSPGAAIAFLLIAPTISLELLKTLNKQQGFFAAMSLAMLMMIGAFLTGLLLNQFIDILSPTWLEQNIEDYSFWQMISLVVILILYFGSLLRRGARSFIAELVPKSFLKRHHHH